MKHVSTSHDAGTATLQDVLDRIAADPVLGPSRKRDLRSAVLCFGKLADRVPASIPLDFTDLRRVLDETEGTLANISAKRRANLRSDLLAAIEASGAHPVLRTSVLQLDDHWSALLDPITNLHIRYGLSRFARWCSLNGILPEVVAEPVVDRFVQDLKARTLVRNVDGQRDAVLTAWNRLVTRKPDLSSIDAPVSTKLLKRIPWNILPATFLADLHEHLAWCAMPDALDDKARAKRLAPATIVLRRNQVHSAVTAAVGAGVDPATLRSLADLIGFDVFKAILRKLFKDDGSVLTAYTHSVAGTLIAIAKEWTEAEPIQISALKKLRRKLGTLPSGLTDKNKLFLRQFDNDKLSNSFLGLPDKLWRSGRRGLSELNRSFLDIQTSLALAILLVIPLRMKNLASLSFRDHLHWPNGRGKPALLLIKGAETKNGIEIEAEIPKDLADRLWAYRTEIAPTVIGNRPDILFVTANGRPRKQGTVTLAIKNAVYRNVGIRLTPHQFRHFAAKLTLDANPGAHELVKQLLVHANMKTTINYYAGTNTLRAGRAHAELLIRLRNELSAPKRKRRRS